MVKLNKFDEILDNKAFSNAIDPFSLPTTSTSFNNKIFPTLDDNSVIRRLDHLDNSNKINKFIPENIDKWTNFDNLKRIRSGNVSSGSGEINALARFKRPYYKYDKMIKKVDSKAISYGFKSEADFAKKLESAAELCKTANGKKIINNNPIWRNLLTSIQKTKHKGKKLTAISALGTASALVIYLAKEQKINTGCFRYKLGDDENGRKNKLIRYKIGGNFCISDDTSTTTNDDNVKILPWDHHPLFHHKRWDCDYENFYRFSNEIDRERIDLIREQGCNGLCDVLNFNTLASFTDNEYQPLASNDSDKDENEFMYICERATFLRTLTSESLNFIDDILTETMNSSLVKKISNMFNKLLFLLIIIFMVYLFLTSYSSKSITGRYISP